MPPSEKRSRGRPKKVVEEVVAPEVDVAFRPNPGPQTSFLAASEFQVLYGGAAGGGKSYAILVDPLRDVHNPNFRGLIIRRSTEELRDLIIESKKLYPQIFKKAEWKERDKTWVFPSGASLWFSFLDRDDDVLRYQGQQFTWVGFDELTQWPTPHAWNYLSSRMRSTDPSLTPVMRATTNPGGPGAWWVKKMFIDPAPAGEAFWATDIETGEILLDDMEELDEGVPNPDYGKPLYKRRFIPAKLKDNPFLTRDGSYRRQLMAMPEMQRRQLLEGDWDAAEGVAFPEWRRDIHVCEPFEIPRSWRKFRSCDYGYGSHSGVLWFAIDPVGALYVYRELYVSKRLAEDLADDILDLEWEENIAYGVLDSSMWHKRGERGPSLAEKMIRRGCRWRPSDRSAGSRVSGKNEIHRLLKVDEETGKPYLRVFPNCKNLITYLPSIPLDKRNPEDVDTDYPHDHLYDALRYGVMSRPKPNEFYDNLTRHSGYQPFDETLGY